MSISLKGYERVRTDDRPLVMGIVNVTPDSFYADSRSNTKASALEKVKEMVDAGVDIVDVGGMSSRPGAKELTVQEEIERLVGPLSAIRSAYPDLWISVDTYRTEVLEACTDQKIDIVNDISGGRLDDGFLPKVAELGLTYVLMHMQGAPRVMQQKPTYEDVVLDILKYTDERIHHCRSLGIEDVIIDPGFGFGKTLEDNYKLLKSLSAFRIFECPILAGVSRKSMIYKALDITPEEALNGTSALHMMVLEQGAHILRVHDVKEAKQCIDLWCKYNNV